MKAFLKIIFGLILLIAIFIITIFSSYSFLVIHKPIESKNLLVESWLIGLGIEKLVEEHGRNDIENIYVVGYNYVPITISDLSIKDFKAEEYLAWKKKKGALLLTNSTLLIDLTRLALDQNDSIKTLSIRASDTRINRIQSHFLVSLNGEFLGDMFASDTIGDYSFKVYSDIKDPQILAICFDNDCFIDGENRNLFVESIKINGLEFKISDTFSLITREENKITTGFDSQADKTAQYIKALKGIPDNYKIITFDLVDRNQTLAAAKAVKSYLENDSIDNLNVASLGLHSRRSLVTYRKVLDPKLKIGVINTKASSFDKNNWYKTPEGRSVMVNEFFSYLANWFELTF